MNTETTSGNFSPTAAQLLEDYHVDARLRGLGERTLETYGAQIEYFLGWIDADIEEVGKDDLKHFLAHLKHERHAIDGTSGLSQSTLKSYFSSINSFYTFLQYEDIVDDNPIPRFRERYLDTTTGTTGSERQLISVEDMSMLVHSVLNVRNRATIMLLAKTGVRRNELVQIDLSDIDWEEQSIRLNPTEKRSNTLVFFDGETTRVLERWVRVREDENPDTDALFTNQYGGRLKRSGVYKTVTKHAEQVGLHDPDSTDLQERFTPHCCRHWFTTHLRRSGMPREFIQELRGDTRGDAIDIYDHIDKQELRESYLAHIPSLGL